MRLSNWEVAESRFYKLCPNKGRSNSEVRFKIVNEFLGTWRSKEFLKRTWVASSLYIGFIAKDHGVF